MKDRLMHKSLIYNIYKEISTLYFHSVLLLLLLFILS